MHNSRFAWLDRIKTVEREYAIVEFAVQHLVRDAERNSLILPDQSRLRLLRLAAKRLGDTYIVRLFVEFEAGLRSFWLAARGTEPPNRTRDLLHGVASTRQIPADRLADAHSVREYRNYLIHRNVHSTDEMPVSKARSHLCRYFAYLPNDW